MTDDDRLRDALTGLVPTPPPAPDRASGARSYARRARRGRIAAGTGVVLVAAVIAVPFALPGGSGDRTEPPTVSTSTPPAVVAGDFSCPPEPGRDDPASSPGGPNTLPANAIAVRMCFVGGMRWQPPQDALTAGVDRVVTTVNDLPVLPEPDACELDLRPTWVMSFQYADGHTQVISGNSSGCGGVIVGTVTRGDRSSADDPLRVFQRLLWEQRASSP